MLQLSDCPSYASWRDGDVGGSSWPEEDRDSTGEVPEGFELPGPSAKHKQGQQKEVELPSWAELSVRQSRKRTAGAPANSGGGRGWCGVSGQVSSVEEGKVKFERLRGQAYAHLQGIS